MKGKLFNGSSRTFVKWNFFLSSRLRLWIHRYNVFDVYNSRLQVPDDGITRTARLARRVGQKRFPTLIRFGELIVTTWLATFHIVPVWLILEIRRKWKKSTVFTVLEEHTKGNWLHNFIYRERMEGRRSRINGIYRKQAYPDVPA